MNAIALCLSFLCVGADPTPKLSGAFIQLNNKAMDLRKGDWIDVCKAMKSIALNTIIIQCMKYRGGDDVPYEFYEKNMVDPLGEILQFCDTDKTQGWQVYVGIEYVAKWDTIRKNEQETADFLDESKAVAKKIWDRYQGRRSFAGWYVPQELANYGYDNGEVALLRGFFLPLSQYCWDISGGKPVAISPYYNPVLASPMRFREDIGQIVSGSRVNIIMLQDGVGVRDIKEGELGQKVVPFYQEMQRICGKDRQLWGNAECLEHFPRQGIANPDFPVRDFGRFVAQRKAIGPLVVKIVVFDFFHYMNPYGHAHSDDLEYVKGEQLLYNAYLKEIQGN
jgi:hypothetical protein